MSNVIANEVVQMQFDNSQFEQGVQESISTLDKLKNALKFNKGADELSRSMANIGKSIDVGIFYNMEKSLGAVEKRMSTFGIMGAAAINKITTSAMNMGKKLVGSVSGPLINKGKQRALNLAQSNFMMQGLLGDAKKVEGVMERVSNSVTDTAYGLDEASIVAAQFLSSGITDLDKLEKALSAVSGAAAMTGANYSEIGDIFTTVAGQGKLMASDLNRLSVRGMNGAATLGKALGKSEEDIRKMVRKGQIDFGTFSRVMYDAFGAQAKKSNETFTGALANMQAALARIGADIYKFGLNDLRDIFNALKDKINAAHKAIQPFIDDLEVFAKKATEHIVALIEKFDVNKIAVFAEKVENLFKTLASPFMGSGFASKFIDTKTWKDIEKTGVNLTTLRKYIHQVAKEYGKGNESMIKANGKFKTSLNTGWLTDDILLKAYKRWKKHVKNSKDVVKEGTKDMKQLSKVAEQVINGQFGNGEDRVKALTKAGYKYEQVQAIVNNRLLGTKIEYDKLGISQKNSAKATKKERKEFEQFRKAWKDSGHPLNEAKEDMKEMTGVEKIILGFDNIFSSVERVGGEIWTTIQDVFGVANYDDFLEPIIDTFLGFTDAIHLSDKAIEGFGILLTPFFELLRQLGEIANDTFSVFAGIGNDVWNTFTSYLEELGSNTDAVNFFGEVTDAVNPFITILGRIPAAIQSVWDVLSNSGVFKIFGAAIRLVLKLIGKLGTAISNFKIKNIKDFFKLDSNPLAKGLEKIKKKLEGAKEASSGLKDSIDTLKIKVPELKGYQRLVTALKNLGKIWGEGLLKKFREFADFLSGIFGKKIKKGADAIIDAFQMPNIDKVTGPIDFIMNALASFIEFITPIPGQIFGILSSITFPMIEIPKFLWENLEIPEFVQNLPKQVLSLFTDIKTNVQTGADGAGTSIDNLKTKITGLTDKLDGFSLDWSGLKVPDSVKDAPSIIENTFTKLKESLTKIHDELNESLSIDKLIGIGIGALIIVLLVKSLLKLLEVFKKFASFPDAGLTLLKDLSNYLRAYNRDVNAEAIRKIAESLTMLAKAMFLLSFIKSDKLYEIVSIFIILGALLAIINHVKQQASKTDSEVGAVQHAIDKITDLVDGIADKFKAMMKPAILGAFALQVGAAVFLVGKTIQMIGEMSPDAVNQGAFVAVSILGILAALIYGVNQLTKSEDSGDFEGVAALVRSLAIVFVAIAIVIKILGTLDLGVLLQGGAAVAAMAGLIIVLGLLFGRLDSDKIEQSGKGILKFAGAIAIIGLVCTLLGAVYPLVFKGIACVGAIMIMMLLLSKVESMSVPQLAGLAALAKNLMILSVSILILGMMGDKALNGILAIAVALAVLLAAAAIAGIPAVTAGLTALTTALDGIALAATGFATAALLFAVAVLAIAAAIWVFGEAIPNLVEGIIEAGQLIKNNKDDFIDGIKAILLGVAGAIVAAANPIGAAVALVIYAVIETIINFGPKILSAILLVLYNVALNLLAFVYNIPIILNKAIPIILNGLSKLREKMDEFWKNLGIMMWNALIEGLATAVEGKSKTVADFLRGFKKDMTTETATAEDFDVFGFITKDIDKSGDNVENKIKEEDVPGILQDQLGAASLTGGIESIKDGVLEKLFGDGFTPEDLKDSIGTEALDTFMKELPEGISMDGVDATSSYEELFDQLGLTIDTEGEELVEKTKNVKENVEKELPPHLQDPNVNKPENTNQKSATEADEAIAQAPTLGAATFAENQNQTYSENLDLESTAITEAGNADKALAGASVGGILNFGKKATKAGTPKIKQGVTKEIKETDKTAGSEPASGFAKFAQTATDNIAKNLKASDKVKEEAKKVKEAEKSLEKGSDKPKEVKVKTKVTVDESSTKEASKDAESSGKAIGADMSKGITSSSKKVTSAINKLNSLGAAKMRASRGKWQSSGNYAIQGLVAAFNHGLSQVTSIAAQIASKANEAYNAKSLISSPSKLWMWSGEYTIAGLVKGFRNKVGDVRSAARAVSDTAYNTAYTPLAKIQNLLESDHEFKPTITPVVDMSNVNAAAGLINSSFGNQAFGLSANVSNMGAFMSAANNFQNGATNLDVVNAISKLRRDLIDMPRNNYNINGITYDDGSNIVGAVETLVRAATIEGRA